jgi:hypothetical protein
MFLISLTVLIIACFAVVFAIGFKLSVGQAYAIAGLPDFNNNNDDTSVQTQQQQQEQPEQTPIEGFSTYQDPSSLFTIQYPTDWFFYHMFIDRKISFSNQKKTVNRTYQLVPL